MALSFDWSLRLAEGWYKSGEWLKLNRFSEFLWILKTKHNNRILLIISGINGDMGVDTKHSCKRSCKTHPLMMT